MEPLHQILTNIQNRQTKSNIIRINCNKILKIRKKLLFYLFNYNYSIRVSVLFLLIKKVIEKIIFFIDGLWFS